MVVYNVLFFITTERAGLPATAGTLATTGTPETAGTSATAGMTVAAGKLLETPVAEGMST
jgi:hypothetical protein